MTDREPVRMIGNVHAVLDTLGVEKDSRVPSRRGLPLPMKDPGPGQERGMLIVVREHPTSVR